MMRENNSSEIMYATMAFPGQTASSSSSNNQLYANQNMIVNASSADVVYSDVDVTTSVTKQRPRPADSRNARDTPSSTTKSKAQSSSEPADYLNVANLSKLYPDNSNYVNMTQIKRPSGDPNAPPTGRQQRPERKNRTNAESASRHPNNVNGFNWDSPGGDINTLTSNSTVNKKPETWIDVIQKNKFITITLALFPILTAAVVVLIVKAARGGLFGRDSVIFHTCARVATPQLHYLHLYDTSVNRGEAIETSQSLMAARQTGAIYWLHVSAAINIVSAHDDDGVALEDFRTWNVIVRAPISFSNERVDTVSRHHLTTLQQGFVVTLSGSLSSQTPCAASTSGFVVDIYSDTVAFSVASSETSTVQRINGPPTRAIHFSKTYIDVGKAWSTEQNAFVAPPTRGNQPRIYFFAFSAESIIQEQAPFSAALVVNTEAEDSYTAVAATTRFFGAQVTVSRTVLLKLSPDDKVTITFWGTLKGATFSGISCNTATSKAAAWAVSTSGNTREGRKVSDDNAWIVEFDEVSLNDGSIWNAAANTAVIKQSGIYCVTFGMLVDGKNNIFASLVLDGVPQTAVQRVTEYSSKISERDPSAFKERSIIVSLRYNSKLHVALNDGGVLMHVRHGLSFSGFRVY